MRNKILLYRIRLDVSFDSKGERCFVKAILQKQWLFEALFRLSYDTIFLTQAFNNDAFGSSIASDARILGKHSTWHVNTPHNGIRLSRSIVEITGLEHDDLIHNDHLMHPARKF